MVGASEGAPEAREVILSWYWYCRYGTYDVPMYDQILACTCEAKSELRASRVIVCFTYNKNNMSFFIVFWSFLTKLEAHLYLCTNVKEIHAQTLN